jgi:hypothetical protein
VVHLDESSFGSWLCLLFHSCYASQVVFAARAALIHTTMSSRVIQLDALLTMWFIDDVAELVVGVAGFSCGGAFHAMDPNGRDFYDKGFEL